MDGVLFNKLASIVEQKQTEEADKLLSLVEQSRLFVFCDSIPIIDNSVLDCFNDFILPFPVTAVEDEHNIVVFSDTIHNEVGLKSNKPFILLRKVSPNIDTWKLPDNEDREYLKTLPFNYRNDIYQILYGDYYINKTEKDGLLNKKSKLNGSLSLHGGATTFGFNIIHQISARAAEREIMYYQQYLMGIIFSCIYRLQFIASPNSFILEESPLKHKVINGHIPRAHQRPKYYIMKPTEIRIKMGIHNDNDPVGHHASPRPHERRRHKRRIFNNDGTIRKIIDVSACWIGIKETICGNKKYVVRVDL